MVRLVPLPTLGIVGGVGMEVDGDGIGNWRRDPFPTTIIPCPLTRSQLNNTCCNLSRVDEDALGVGAPYHKDFSRELFPSSTPRPPTPNNTDVAGHLCEHKHCICPWHLAWMSDGDNKARHSSRVKRRRFPAA